jgi:hypothetical protein
MVCSRAGAHNANSSDSAALIVSFIWKQISFQYTRNLYNYAALPDGLLKGGGPQCKQLGQSSPNCLFHSEADIISVYSKPVIKELQSLTKTFPLF